MQDSKNILFMCDCLERYRFMNRLASALPDHHCTFITSEPLVKLFALFKGQNCIFVKAKHHLLDSSKSVEILDIAGKTIEFLNDEVTKEKASLDITSIVFSLNKYFKRTKPDVAIIWNGQQIIGRALTKYCADNDIETRYLEISNLPDKLFCDVLGVNALSSIAKKPEILDKYSEVDDEFHADWIKFYNIEKSKKLPQSIKKNSDIFLNFANKAIKLLIQPIGSREIKLNRLFNPQNKINLSKAILTDNLEGINYIFLALQVSNDTQIKLHSKVNNLEAIKLANEIAIQNGVKLLVKLHPAETNQIEADQIIELQRKMGFIISNNNTTDLIKSSCEVATINSTVGLEAKIIGRNVTVLGNAYYTKFNYSRIKKYIHNYLVDNIDYFSNTAIDQVTALKILQINQSDGKYNKK